MDGEQDLGAIARGIIDANLYMTLGTVDLGGRPWVAPVFYAAAGYTQFYWISSPEVTHSRNLAQRPHVSIVVLDSRVPASTGQAVYMSAEAEELAGADLDHGVEVYPGPPERGGRVMAPEDLRPPAAYRLPHVPRDGVAALDPVPAFRAVSRPRPCLRPSHRGDGAKRMKKPSAPRAGISPDPDAREDLTGAGGRAERSKLPWTCIRASPIAT